MLYLLPIVWWCAKICSVQHYPQSTFLEWKNSAYVSNQMTVCVFYCVKSCIWVCSYQLDISKIVWLSRSWWWNFFSFSLGLSEGFLNNLCLSIKIVYNIFFLLLSIYDSISFHLCFKDKTRIPTLNQWFLLFLPPIQSICINMVLDFTETFYVRNCP